MKAAQINDYGDASIIKIAEIDKPIAKDGQVVVEVHASSLNPFDSVILAGYMWEMIPLQLPITLGGDIAGVVVEVGSAVQGFTVGDSIYGQANAVAGSSGALAEFAVTSAGQIALAPSTISLQEAASLPLVGISALQALTEHINLVAEQKIFITGGAGGIGRIAIQVAKNIGAYVATTATGEGIGIVKSLGADEVIDYKTQNYAQILNEYDAVFDTVGGDQINTVLDILKKDGIAVTVAGQFDLQKVEECGVVAVAQQTRVTTEALNVLTNLVDSGIVETSIGKIFTLDQIQEAFVARETGAIKGKIVVQIKQ